MGYIVLAFLFGIIPAVIAANKGHNATAWWVYGALLFPIAFVHALLVNDAGRTRVCPFCAEKIKRGAVVCPHCQRDLPPEPRIEQVVVSRNLSEGNIFEVEISDGTGQATQTNSKKIASGPIVLLVAGLLAIMAYFAIARFGWATFGSFFNNYSAFHR